jgi:hypothetical protein
MTPSAADSAFVDRCGRLVRQLAYRRVCRVYVLDLEPGKTELVHPSCAVELRVNCPEALEILSRGDPAYMLDRREISQIPRQVREGEACFSGWVRGELACYGWVQFKYRRLAALTTLRLPRGFSYVYRCFTRADYRGLHLYPASLTFAYRWLAERGCTRVFIDHAVDNLASERGIVRSGMRYIGDYTVVALGPIKWAKLSETVRRELTGA